MLGFYVLWQWFSTMYLRHHWRIDLLGGLAYSAFAFSFFYRSLGRIDRAYATGVSGGNGWQRLFEGTKLQYLFDMGPERGYTIVMEDSESDQSGRTSLEQVWREHGERDLEAAWVDDFGATWRLRGLEIEK